MFFTAASLSGAILATLLMCGQSVLQYNQDGLSLDRGTRYKRSFLGAGAKTVQKLLKTAEQFSSSETRRSYRKFGSYHTAMDDFNSLKPTNVNTVKMGNGLVVKEGTIGGNKVYVYEGGLMDRAILDIVPIFDTKAAARARGQPRPPIETIHYNL